MRLSGLTAAVLIPLFVTLGGAARAGAATTDIGAVTEIRDGKPPTETAPGGNVVQVAEAAGTYAVPAGYGTITSWRHSAGASAGTLTFKVYRPTGPLREFLVVASDTRAVTAGSVQSFPVRIRVRPGDRIGLSSEDLQLVYETFNPADRLGFFSPDPPPCTIKATDGEPFPEFRLDVAATLKSSPKARRRGSMPAVTDLCLAPRAFQAARSGPSLTQRRNRGASVSYSLGARAAVRFTVRRRGRRLAGRFTHRGTKGINTVRFSGRLAGRQLRPGAYTLVATPRVRGRRGRSATTRFRITR